MKDELDVGAMCRRYGPMVLRRCRQLLRNDDDARDACQDVFVRLLERRKIDAQYPSSLLYRIATNVCLNRIRDRGRRPEDTMDDRLLTIARLEDPGGGSRRGVRPVGVRRSEAFDAPSQGSAPMTDQLPDIVLERYRLHELSPDDATAIDARIDRDADARARLAALDASDALLRDDVERVARRLEAAPVVRRRPLAWVLPIAVGAAAVTVAVTIRTGNRAMPVVERLKGTDESSRPLLMLYRRTAESSERLADGGVARAGDVIRVGYRAAGRRYGAIVSIDGRGTVTMHLPSVGTRSVALGHDATVLLDRAYELDDAPKWERFYFIAGESPFDLGPVLEAVRAATPRLALLRGLDQSTFTLQKESGR